MKKLKTVKNMAAIPLKAIADEYFQGTLFVLNYFAI